MTQSSVPVTDRREEVERSGYAVVPSGIEPELLEAVVRDIAAFTRTDPDDPATWEETPTLNSVGMSEMYHFQSMWDVRQHPRLYEVFTGIHGTEALWVSIDRVAMKLPVRPGTDRHGLGLHWDTDIGRYPELPFHVQGVLALRDTDEDMGGFQCSPEAYRDLEAILAAHETTDRRVLAAALGDYPVRDVPLRAGDIVIWTSLLPHGNGTNRSGRPRIGQYVTMNPANPADEAQRRNRIEAWRANRPAGRPQSFPGDPRGIEEARDQPARLTPLGRRLLGLDPWE